MQFQFLGSTGLNVSRLCFGTVGLTKDKFHKCKEAGINFFDTADVYDDGQAEILLGELITKKRDEVVISSKCGFPTTGDVSSGGLSRRHIFQALEGSLKRLKTDYVDFYFVHTFDPNTPIEETMRALDDLVQQGKVRYLGVSNWAAWQIATSIGISRCKYLNSFKVIQPLYNLVKRQAEVEIFPLAEAENLAVVPYSPLAGGLLSGKYSGDYQSDGGRISKDRLSQLRYGKDQYFTIAKRFSNYASDHDLHPAALALAWVMSNPVVTAPIFGASKLSQIDIALSALEIEMTSELRVEISSLSDEPPLATDRLEEQKGFFYKDCKPSESL